MVSSVVVHLKWHRCSRHIVDWTDCDNLVHNMGNHRVRRSCVFPTLGNNGCMWNALDAMYVPMRWWLDRQLVCRRHCSSLFVLWLLLDGSYRLVNFLQKNKNEKKKWKEENYWKKSVDNPIGSYRVVPSIESSWSRWIVWCVVVWCVYEIPLFGFAYSVTVWCWWVLEFIWKWQSRAK